MKKHYSAVVTIYQKQEDGIVEQVDFDFGENLYAAREFIQSAEPALTAILRDFEIGYREDIIAREEQK